MKRIKQTILSTMLAFLVLFAGTMPQTMTANASASYMKHLGVKFGIKPEKTYTFKSKISGGVSDPNMTWNISDVKFSNGKNGYKKLTFIATMKNEFRPTSSEISTLGSLYESGARVSLGGGFYAIVDGESGLDLERKNDYDVTVKSKTTSKTKTERFENEEGAWISFHTVWQWKVTVVYPEDYEDLYIGFGGKNAEFETNVDKACWDGEVPFGKTSYYKKGKTNSRWQKVSELE